MPSSGNSPPARAIRRSAALEPELLDVDELLAGDAPAAGALKAETLGDELELDLDLGLSLEADPEAGAPQGKPPPAAPAGAGEPSFDPGLGHAPSAQAEPEDALPDLGYRHEDVAMAKSRMQSAEAQYSEANDEFGRQKRLYENDATTLVELKKAEEQFKKASAELDEARTNSQKLKKGARGEEIEQAKSSAEKADSELRYYQASLEDYTLKSPFNGVVTDKFRNVGEAVDVGTPVLELVNPDKLRIRAELEETDVGKVKEGQSVEVTTDAYKEKIYKGTVYRVLPNVKRKSQRTFEPMASFDINTQIIFIRLEDFSNLRNNMTVTVRFLQ